MFFLSLSSGVHILQMKSGREWDENTGEAVGVLQYAYNGEDFLELDFQTLTWIALKPEAGTIKKIWDASRDSVKYAETLLTQFCPQWLKKYVDGGRHFLQRTGRIT